MKHITASATPMNLNLNEVYLAQRLSWNLDSSKVSQAHATSIRQQI
jgi:hypothetical protein